MAYEIHPAAEIFPRMSAEEFAGLVTDIEKHGLREPIVLCAGKVLDGRNRLEACEMLGIVPQFETWPNSEDPHAYVVSKNLHRRHLNEGQRAMIATKLANRPHGDQSDAPIGASSQDEAAEMLNVSRRAVQRAKVVQEKGTPEEIAAVESGEAAVSAIAETVQERDESGTFEEMLEAGKNLLAAAESLSATAFNKKMKELSISPRNARRLRQVASHPEIASGKWNEFLPSSLRPLGELARLTPEQFRSHMHAGHITPDIGERRAHALVMTNRSEGVAAAPSEAKRTAHKTGVPQIGSDGNIHLGADEHEAREAQEQRDQTYAVIDAVNALSTMPPVDEWIIAVEPWRMVELVPETIIAAHEWLGDLIPKIAEKKNEQ